MYALPMGNLQRTCIVFLLTGWMSVNQATLFRCSIPSLTVSQSSAVTVSRHCLSPPFLSLSRFCITEPLCIHTYSSIHVFHRYARAGLTPPCRLQARKTMSLAGRRLQSSQSKSTVRVVSHMAPPVEVHCSEVAWPCYRLACWPIVLPTTIQPGTYGREDFAAPRLKTSASLILSSFWGKEGGRNPSRNNDVSLLSRRCLWPATHAERQRPPIVSFPRLHTARQLEGPKATRLYWQTTRSVFAHHLHSISQG